MTRSRDVADTQDNQGGAVPPVVAGKNAVINGGFDFSQRGSGALPANAYTLDRWFLDTFGTSANGLTVQLRTDAGQVGFSNYARVSAGSSTGTNINFTNSFETSEVRKLQGKTVTVSFKYKLPVNFTNQWGIAAYYSTNIDQNITSFGASGAIAITSKTLTNTTSWTSDSLTFTVPTNATSLNVYFNNGNNVVSTAQFDVAQVQLELGSVPTTFSRAGGSIGGELALCQRYYWRSVHWGSGTIFNNNGYVNVMNPVQMRGTPSVAKTSNGDALGWTTIATITVNDITKEGFNYMFAYTATNYIATRCLIYLEASAEL